MKTHDAVTATESAGNGPKPNHGLAKVKDAAEFLSLSEAAVYRRIAEGLIPCRKFGRTVRVPWIWLRVQGELSADV